jgi:hypothetical protein
MFVRQSSKGFSPVRWGSNVRRIAHEETRIAT